MQRLLRSNRALLASLVASSILVGTSAADLELTRSGGVLGATLTYDQTGDAFEPFFLAISLSGGPTPIAIVDPLDPRSLSVGLDLVNLWSSGFLDGTGESTLVFPLTVTPGLQGVALFAQSFTFPGAGTLVDDISNPTAFRLGAAGTSTFAVGEMADALNGHSATTLNDGRVLIAGGAVDDGLGGTIGVTGFQLFDPQTGMFEATTGTMQIGRAAHTATLLDDGRVLLLGGADAAGIVTATGDIWDPNTGLATPITPMSSARTQHTATLLADGRVFVSGGVSSFDLSDPLGALGSATSTTRVYDPVTNTWSNGPNMPLPRLGHTASLLGDGRVLIVGGVEVGSLFGIPTPSFSNDCRRYDPVGNQLLSTPSISGARAFPGHITLANGNALVAGGADGSLITQVFNTLDSVRIYNHVTNSWSSAGSLGTARAYGTLLNAGDTIVMIGGLASVDVSAGTGATATAIETTDATAATWSTSGNMLFPRALPVSALIEDGGRVLTTGEGDNGSGGVTDDLTAEVYIVP